MSEPERPNPDTLLAALQKEEAKKKRATLKVFFGMAPGVGKTYAMLEAARRELGAGRDVVIGYVETHGRKETEVLAEGLPVIPRLSIEYRGVTLAEMDRLLRPVFYGCGHIIWLQRLWSSGDSYFQMPPMQSSAVRRGML